MTRERSYWLFKSEPDVYSFGDLQRDRRTHWEGVRNFQARNLLRDEVRRGDGVLFYHSNATPMAIAGIARVVADGYPDHSAFDPKARYHDPRSDPENPTWFMVDIEAVCAFAEPLTRRRLEQEKALAGMMLLRRGARLSVQPVSPDEWRHVLKMAGITRDPLA